MTKISDLTRKKQLGKRSGNQSVIANNIVGRDYLSNSRSDQFQKFEELDDLNDKISTISRMVCGDIRKGEIVDGDSFRILNEFKSQYPNRDDWEEGLDKLEQQYLKQLEILTT